MSANASEDQLKFDGFTLDQLIRSAWNLPDDGPMLTGEPDRVRKDKWNVVAKAARAQGDPPLDEDDVDTIMRKLLEERFKLVVHAEDVTVDAYDLVAVNAKLKRADPGERTRCYQRSGTGRQRSARGESVAEQSAHLPGHNDGAVREHTSGDRRLCEYAGAGHDWARRSVRFVDRLLGPGKVAESGRQRGR